jgi:hypothetical protein
MSEEEVTEEVTETEGEWRTAWAGDDEAKSEHIGRFASVNAALDGGYSAKLKIADGSYKKADVFPGEGTDDEKSAWRTENGIPESAEKYEFGEDNESLAQIAFENNMSPASAKVALDWHESQAEAQRNTLDDADTADIEATEDALRSEWGAEYRTNMNKVQGLLDTAPEGFREQLMDARLKDGTMLGNDPNALKFLAGLALIQNPTTTLVPAGGDLNSAIGDEMKELESMMGSKTSEYWKGPKADDNQARYRELLNAQSK